MIAYERAQGGFTLLEILVAMAVLAIALTSVFRLQSGSIALSEAARFKALAPVLAERQMAVLAQEHYETDGDSGEFGGPYAGYGWAYEIRSGEDTSGWDDLISENQAGLLKQIRLTVTGPGGNRRFVLNTWRYLDAGQADSE
ncbi:MAG: prepilin-type N-terminal cleavage/methylation domain-containing protein [Desulfobacterales bacterium]|nr:prepilin-type N-terminal cleavage/methylation domain-containing protein [Desulfobacterales bacterium]